jgi:hypothetical protein
MSLTTRRAALAAAITALLLPLAATAGEARGTAAPDLNLRTLPGPGNPLEVDRLERDDLPPSPLDCVEASGDPYDEGCYQIALAVSATEDVPGATVSVIDRRGLYVDPLVAELGPLEADNTELVRFAVRARTTGLHTLSLLVTAPGAEPRQVSHTYVWRAGGEPIAGDDSLAGRLYARVGLDSYPCAPSAGCTFRDPSRVVFLDDVSASTALAADGRRGCPPRAACPRYHYDEASGLVQVGRGTIGRISNEAAFVDGERYTRLVYPRPGQRLDGLWYFGADVDEARGIFEQRLRLRDDGRFRLSYAVDTTRYGDPDGGSTYDRSSKGRYRIGSNGRIALVERRGTVVGTLAIVATTRGRARPATKGVWLDLPLNPPRGRSFVDGNRLYPVPLSDSRG